MKSVAFQPPIHTTECLFALPEYLEKLTHQ